ncbi:MULTISPECIES: hypothetical protein [unclassified Agarivorans]|uniref:hypothetical protein n=1 Tax=unclassified Agarivorans TaxID=2636026 RepID=UPI0026E38B61|nr:MULTISPECIES: hypothetical protein [unclassified Agarivorans]MDO6686842.1 hypothetical protein [Agarivorans sp. 3_MG-2023]MDO6716639.1 hypothetical protein [Agarivorans sp. 2_MG-2023]
MAKHFLALMLSCGVLTSSVLAAPLSDPTAPPNSRSSTSSATKQVSLPSIQAIIVGGKEPGAILNQRFVGVKQSISGYTLSRVHQDYVVLTRANKQYRIQLDKVSVKRVTGQGQ